MPYVLVTVVLVGLLCLLDLVLTVGGPRRLRRLADLATRPAVRSAPDMLPEGARIGDFHTTTVDTGVVSRDRLRGLTLVGFFAPDSPTSAQQVPGFVARAGETPGGLAQVLAVVVGTPREAAVLRDRLRLVAHVVVEEERGPVGRAFAVGGLPVFCVVNADGTILATGTSPDRLPTTVPA